MHIYLDYAATTPLNPKAKAAMAAAPMGNPSSLHSFGQEASAALFNARRVIAKSLDIANPAGYEQITFTGSATEANNLALRGTVKTNWTNRTNWTNKSNRPRIIISAIEHESILETARDLEREGAELVILPVDRKGLVNLSALRKALTPNTAIVSIMYANNEVGAIQPIAEIAKIVNDFRVRSVRNVRKVGDSRGFHSNKRSDPTIPTIYPLLHSDAVQAFQYLDCNPDKLGIDLLTLSAHKIYGPKGIGCLYMRDRSLLSPIITGGGQENGIRSGTENVAAVMGFAEAARLTVALRNKETKRMARLQKYFWGELRAVIPRIALNGPILRNEVRLSNNLNVWFPGVPAQEFLVALDLAGVSASSGSACASRATEPSYVLRALGYTKKRAAESVRFTLGRMTATRDIDLAIKVIHNTLREVVRPS